MKRSIVLLFLFLSVQVNRIDVASFLEKDKTNEMEYSESFDCVQFSELLVKNSSYYGLQSREIGMFLRKDGEVISHMIVEIEQDGVLYWVEPQNDMMYKISEVGEPLCFVDGKCVAEILFLHKY